MRPPRPQLFAGGRALKADEVESSDEEDEKGEEGDGGSGSELGSDDEGMSDSEEDEEVRQFGAGRVCAVHAAALLQACIQLTG